MAFEWRAAHRFKDELTAITGIPFKSRFWDGLKSAIPPTDEQRDILSYLAFNNAIQLEARPDPKSHVWIHAINSYALQICAEDLKNGLSQRMASVQPVIEYLTGQRWTLNKVSLTTKAPVEEGSSRDNFYSRLAGLHKTKLIQVYCCPDNVVKIVDSTGKLELFAQHFGPELAALYPPTQRLLAISNPNRKDEITMTTQKKQNSPRDIHADIINITKLHFIYVFPDSLQSTAKPNIVQQDMLSHFERNGALKLGDHPPTGDGKPHPKGLVWINWADPYVLRVCMDDLIHDLPRHLKAAKPVIEGITKGITWDVRPASLTAVLPADRKEAIIDRVARLEQDGLLRLDYRGDLVAIHDISPKLIKGKFEPKPFRASQHGKAYDPATLGKIDLRLVGPVNFKTGRLYGRPFTAD